MLTGKIIFFQYSPYSRWENNYLTRRWPVKQAPEFCQELFLGHPALSVFGEAQLLKVKLSQAYYKTDPCLALTGHIDGGQQVDWLIWPKVSSHMSDQRYKDRERLFNKLVSDMEMVQIWAPTEFLPNKN